MRTQNQILMALAIVLALSAGGLLAWQITRHDTDVGATRPISPEPAATVARLPENSEEFPENSEDATRSKPKWLAPGAIPPLPGNIQHTCKNGFTVERDRTARFQGFLCNSSAYEDYSTEALESLAYGDADAASTLAFRLRHSDYPRGLKLALRSAALGGGDVSTLISATYWRSLHDENGEPSLAGFAQAYVLHSLIRRIRDSATNISATYEQSIRQLSDDPVAVLDQLDVVVEQLLEEARQIELEVTGNSTIGGDDNV